MSDTRDPCAAGVRVAEHRANPAATRRACAFFVLLVALALPLLLQAEPGGENDRGAGPRDFLELMARFSRSGVVRARVEETRKLALLSDPLETAGVVYFAPPNRLARYTTVPGTSRVVVNGTRVAFVDETGHRTLDLGSSEVAQTLIGNLVFLLRGDVEELRERYAVDFHASGQAWQLDLEPRSRAVRALVANTRFRGHGWVLESMETYETNGDHTITRFLDVETGVEISPAELDRIFSLAAEAGQEP